MGKELAESLQLSHCVLVDGDLLMQKFWVRENSRKAHPFVLGLGIRHEKARRGWGL